MPSNTPAGAPVPSDDPQPGSALAGPDAASSEAATTVSPASTGPAGQLFEGRVGAQYLLSLLGAGAPRGLPGAAVVESVGFQRAASGFRMDDVLVRARLADGTPATLDIQAKRTLTFAPSESTFADVVARAVASSARPDFDPRHDRVAVAIARTTTKIEQHVQTVLAWARDLATPETFFEHLGRERFAAQPMRDFVAAFRTHMAACGAVADEAATWQLLRCFLVLDFDFEHPGSQAEYHACLRCAQLLVSEEGHRGAELWDSLAHHALELDARAGEATPESLKTFLTTERSYRLAGERRWRLAREHLAQISNAALAQIRTIIRGKHLPRLDAIAQVRAALDLARYVEVHGAGGTGKSAVLATLAREQMAQSLVVVLAPARVPAGGWSALRDRLGIDAGPREFLTDLAGDGGGTLFIDGIDRFDDAGERATLVDLLEAAATVPGFKVLATAREDFSDPDQREWLPPDALIALGVAPPVLVGELTDAEAEVLGTQDASLAALLSPDHPARPLARNLYRLERLARVATAVDAGSAPLSEAQMARQWWDSGDGVDVAGRRNRRRLLHDLAVHALSSAGPMDTSGFDAVAVDELISSQTLREVRRDRVELAHDVLRDWAIGCLLVDESAHIGALPLDKPAPGFLVRGAEMAARLLAEGLMHGTDAAMEGAAGVNAYGSLLAAVSQAAHGSWRRSVLLALVRSERADQALTRCSAPLAAGNAQLLKELIGYVVAVDSRQGAEAWAAYGIEAPPQLLALPIPSGQSWLRLIEWTLRHPELVPDAAVPVVADLYAQWSMFCVGFANLETALSVIPAIVARLHDWLARAEGAGRPQDYDTREAWLEAEARPSLELPGPDERAIRMACLLWAGADMARTEAYLRLAARRRDRDDFCRGLLDRRDATPVAAPGALTDLFIAALCVPSRRASSREGPFAEWDTVYSPSSPARRPFLELLRACPAEGLRLVRTVVAHAVARRDRANDPPVEVNLGPGPRSFALSTSYVWPRGHRGAVLGSALMALEAWGHERIKQGDAISDVLTDVLGPDDSCAAFVAVAVDLALSHLPDSLDCAAMFASSAQLLALDYTRTALDAVQEQRATVDRAIGAAWMRAELQGLATLESLQKRPSRQMRLNDFLFNIGRNGPQHVRDTMQKALLAEVSRLGGTMAAGAPVNADSWSDPQVAVAVALHRLDPGQYTALPNIDGSFGYRPSALEVRIRNAAHAASWPRAVDVQMRLLEAVRHSPVDPAFLREALDWLDRAQVELDHEGALTKTDRDYHQDVRRSACTAAMLVLRDGDVTLRDERWIWAHREISAAIGRTPPPGWAIMDVPFNDAALAAMGLLASIRALPTSAPRHHVLRADLLQLAARRDAGLSAVLAAELEGCRSVDQLLGRSFARLGLASMIQEVRPLDDVPDAGPALASAEGLAVRLALNDQRLMEREQVRMALLVRAEADWLAGTAHEPAWPEFPMPSLIYALRASHARETTHPTTVESAAATTAVPQFVVDKATASLWLQVAGDLLLPDAPEHARMMLDHYWPWTARANGVGVDAPDLIDASQQMRLGWNATYFGLMLRHRIQFEPDAFGDCLQRAGELQAEAFFDAAAALLRDVDRLWLQEAALSEALVRQMRDGVIERLVSTREWQHLADQVSDRATLSMGDVIAAVFFGVHELSKGPRCLLKSKGIDRAEAFLPQLANLAERGARSMFVAAAFLSLMGVDPRPQHLQLLVRVHAAWCSAHGVDRRFWEGFGAADRLCAWIATAFDGSRVPPTAGAKPGAYIGAEPALVAMLDSLVRVGSPAAQELERRLGIVRREAR